MAEPGHGRRFPRVLSAAAVLMSVSMLATPQDAPPRHADGIAIRGTVHTQAGELVGDAVVRLEEKNTPGALQTRTSAAGVFAFSVSGPGNYILSAEKSGMRSRAVSVDVLSPGDRKQVDLVLAGSSVGSQEGRAGGPAGSKAFSASSMQTMEFADSPSFSIAGVTDWTAAGGHGSDTSLRTSESLTREALTLRAGDPGQGAAGNATAKGANESESKLRTDLAKAPYSFEANRQLGLFYLRAGRYAESISLLEESYKIDPARDENELDLALALKETGDSTQARVHIEKLLARRESADLHRTLGELDEKLNDPLRAVYEFERAVALEPSETNYFEWGSELLLHRAVWQAQGVFQKGAMAYPKSARMLTALGAALFGGARYDEAALRLCDASDLNPSDTEPYVFMGKIEIAAPSPLPCVEQKLARFVQQQPGSSLANYFYAMALWKGHAQPEDQGVLPQVEALLTKAIAMDGKCADAYLQLGVLYASKHSYEKAIGAYSKAIEANPELADAYYRLGVAYDRTGEAEKAKREFQLHDELKKKQAAAVEAQRREVKQFLVVAPGQTTYPPVH